MRMGGIETKILFWGTREGRRRKKGCGRKKYLYLCFLVYICKYWFRIRHCGAGCRQPRALLGVEHFQGCQRTERIQRLALLWELCLVKAVTELLPPLQGPGWAGTELQSKGWVSAEGLIWGEWHWRVAGEPELNEIMLEGRAIKPWMPRPHFCLHCSLSPSHI